MDSALVLVFINFLWAVYVILVAIICATYCHGAPVRSSHCNAIQDQAPMGYNIINEIYGWHARFNTGHAQYVSTAYTLNLDNISLKRDSNNTILHTALQLQRENIRQTIDILLDM